MRNQCDGCCAGLPIVEGIHRTPDSRIHMECTANRYQETSTDVTPPRADARTTTEEG